MQPQSIMMRAVVFSAVCIALNVGLNKIAAVLQLPVFMDTVGTVLSGAMVPPAYSFLVGIVSNLIGGVVTHPSIPFYIGTQVVVSLMSIFGYRRGWFDTLPAAVGVGLATNPVFVALDRRAPVHLVGATGRNTHAAQSISFSTKDGGVSRSRAARCARGRLAQVERERRRRAVKEEPGWQAAPK